MASMHVHQHNTPLIPAKAGIHRAVVLGDWHEVRSGAGMQGTGLNDRTVSPPPQKTAGNERSVGNRAKRTSTRADHSNQRAIPRRPKAVIAASVACGQRPLEA